jgi:two-component system chemotaxis response regulator CheY
MSQFSDMKVLIVDDESSLTKLLKILLEEELACEVHTANDSVEAYDLLAQEEFDLVSLDHTMPRLTGMALLKKLRTEDGPNRKTPVLIFTGFLGQAKAADAQIYENTIFLEKPIDDERYLRNIKIAYGMKLKN